MSPEGKKVSINDLVLFLMLNLVRLNYQISVNSFGCLLVYFRFGNSSP